MISTRSADLSYYYLAQHQTECWIHFPLCQSVKTHHTWAFFKSALSPFQSVSLSLSLSSTTACTKCFESLMFRLEFAIPAKKLAELAPASQTGTEIVGVRPIINYKVIESRTTIMCFEVTLLSVVHLKLLV